MSISANASNDQVIAQPKFYQGIGTFQVIAANPSKEEMEKLLNATLSQDINYLNINLGDGRSANKVMLIVKSLTPVNGQPTDAISRVEFLVSPNVRVSQGGKTQFINKYGDTAWAMSLDELAGNEKFKWFETASARPAYEGEEDLINFLKAWANVARGGECTLDSIDRIVQGDVTELRQLISQLKDNTVRLLCGVDISSNGNMYQKIYTKYFGRTYGKDGGFVKALLKDYGEFKSDYDKSDLTFKEYTQSAVSAPAATEAAVSDASDYYSQS